MDEIDWRVKLTAKVSENKTLPWDSREVKKGDLLQLVSAINLPKQKTLTIPVPSLIALNINTSKKAWKKCWDIRKRQNIDSSLRKEIKFQKDETAFDTIELIITSVISAYSAVETFCNESIPIEHEYWHHKRSGYILEKSDKKQIERYLSTGFKLNQVLPDIFNVESPKGKSPVWVSYKKLKECRDKLIHPKSHETRSVDTQKTNLWDVLFNIRQPYLYAKDIFDWFLKDQSEKPLWYIRYPN
jgi:hypothetical protein